MSTPTSERETLLHVEGLVKHFPIRGGGLVRRTSSAVQAVDGVDFEVRTGETFSRSEGLAVASFDMFIGGAFSGRPGEPLRADAGTLGVMDAAERARVAH